MRYSVAIEDIKRIMDIRDIPAANFLCGNVPMHVDFVRQKTGFGHKVFMVCPRCGSRRVKLYVCKGELICRECYPKRIYKARQDTTDGGYREIAYRLNRLAAQYNILIEYPFSYYQMVLKKPKHMHHDTWEKITRQLQLLENMRFQALFLKRRYSPETIRYALRECLYVHSLSAMKEYVIDWDACVSYMRRLDESIRMLREKK